MTRSDGLDLLASALGLESPELVFPWQERLLARFRAGEIPAGVDTPTGLGKTSVMAIWLAARAGGARLPRRLVYVVDRRAVVDQATDVALTLRKLVDDSSELKEALGLRGDRSLPISTLRGKFVDNREWLEDPGAPAIIVGTVDMVGSRLLFEGYGVSRKMRPYHAGLLGADTLVVLDEAHLVPPFEHLLRAVATDPALRPRGDDNAALVPQFKLLAMSATGRSPAGDTVELSEGDHGHEVVGKRLNATKSLRLESLDGETKLDEALATQAWALTDGGTKAARVIVYSDQRKVAEKAKQALEKLARGKRAAGAPAVEISTELFVGGRRVFEREQAKERLKKLGFIAGSDGDRQNSTFLFATSAGEVGVDLDADHMVCDLVAWERMVQRLGRVNRRGDGEARVVVIFEPVPEDVAELLEKDETSLNPKQAKKVKPARMRRAARGVLELLPESGGARDASPRALLDLRRRAATDTDLEQRVRDATTPEPLRPALTRPLVEAWAMTSLEKHPGRPAIQPWLRGWIEDDPPQTAVLWRTYLPVRDGGKEPGRATEIKGFFEAAPPHTSELLETETYRVVEWVKKRAKKICDGRKKGETATSDHPLLGEENVVAFALGPDGGLRASLKLEDLTQDQGSKDSKEELKEKLAAATLILDRRLGGLKDGLLDHKEDGTPWTADDNEREWLDEGTVGFRVRLTGAATPTEDHTWRERFRFALEHSAEGEPTRWLSVEKWRDAAATEEDRSSAPPQLVDEHQSSVEERARDIAKAVGLSGELADTLALAARLHDEGKRTPRWQRAFNAPDDGEYAKTEGPISYRLLDGYRHELGSLLAVEQNGATHTLSAEQRDLLLHLIAAHHGFARPVISTSGCEGAPPSVLEEKAAEIAMRFARQLDRWGPWGLAWWEALLRAADHQASREIDARRAIRGGS